MSSLAKEFLEQYKAFLEALVERELLIDANPLELTDYSVKDEEGNSVRNTTLSWSGASGLSYLFSDFSSIEQYVEVIRRRDFNFCLSDGSFIQVFYQIEDEEIRSHRLCFYPCPFAYSNEDLGDIGLADLPALMSPQELISGVRLASPIRFDYDRDFSDERHAHAHVTINQTTCRVPTFGPVSLGHFMRFVFRYFYADHFDAEGWWPEVRPRVFKKTLGHPRPHEFYIESSIDFD